MEPLERATPSSVKVDSAKLKEMYRELGRHNVHSVMITRHSKVIAEGWWGPYRPEDNHILYSVSKSFVGTAVGFAVTEGKLSIEDRILSVLDGILPSKPCVNMEKLTVRDVLMMSTGQKDERNIFREGEPWTYSLLSAYIDETPGESFRYISSSTYLLSAVIWKVTGQTVFEYLKERLFEPMGFSEGIWWEESPEGLNNGFNGLNATAEDVTKLALLYLNKGKWKGKRLLSEEWVREAGSVQIDNSDNGKNQELGYRQGFGEFTEDWKSGYGYLFWRCQAEGAYRGDGIFGQMCIVMPRQDMTAAVAAGCEEPGEILKILWKYLLTAVDSESIDSRQDVALKNYLKQLELPVVQKKGEEEIPHKTWKKRFRIAENGLQIRTLELEFREQEDPVLNITTEKGVFRARIGQGRWARGDTGYTGEKFSCDNVVFFQQAACCGAWQNGDYIIKLAYTQTPFVDILRLRFSGGVLEGSYAHTVKYGKKSYRIMGVEE